MSKLLKLANNERFQWTRRLFGTDYKLYLVYKPEHQIMRFKVLAQTANIPVTIPTVAKYGGALKYDRLDDDNELFFKLISMWRQYDSCQISASEIDEMVLKVIQYCTNNQPAGTAHIYGQIDYYHANVVATPNTPTSQTVSHSTYIDHAYSHKPTPIFHGFNCQQFGIELEITGSDASIQSVMELLNSDGFERSCYCKHDGSIGYNGYSGHEIVFHPRDFESWKEYKPVLEEALKKLTDLGYVSHNGAKCGLHIHASRIPSDAIGKLLDFGNNVIWSNLVRFSRRSSSQISRWANRYNRTNYSDAVNENNYDRMRWLNLRNSDTIEFRLWRGTLKLGTLWATLELTNALINYAIGSNTYSSWDEFIGTNFWSSEFVSYIEDRQLLPVDTDDEAEAC